jgi:hypothetical protein
MHRSRIRARLPVLALSGPLALVDSHGIRAVAYRLDEKAAALVVQ